MHDFIWFMIVGIVFVLLGLFFIRLGLLIWKKQRIDLIIQYHMNKVNKEDKQAYCKLCGIGILIFGIGLILSGIFTLFSGGLPGFIPMTVGLVSGITLLIIAVIRYNR